MVTKINLRDSFKADSENEKSNTTTVRTRWNSMAEYGVNEAVGSVKQISGRNTNILYVKDITKRSRAVLIFIASCTPETNLSSENKKHRDGRYTNVESRKHK